MANAGGPILGNAGNPISPNGSHYGPGPIVTPIPGLPPPGQGPISTPVGPAMNPQGGAPIIPQSQLYEGIPANNNTFAGGSPQISNLMQMLQGGGMQSMMQQLFSGKGPQTGMNPMNPMGANPSAQPPGAQTGGGMLQPPGAGQAQMAMGQSGGKGPRPQTGGPSPAPVTPQ